MAMSSSTSVLVVSLVLVAAALLYRAALPKPIPGIPYNKASARSILGDIPAMLKWKAETRQVFSWMLQQCDDLKTPMIQLFVTPLSKPWVILVDSRESEDILMRRAREFDRSNFIINIMQPILRDMHFGFPTNAKFRAHRALLADTMNPAFLDKVVAPQLYDAMANMLQLWRKKLTLAKTRSFDGEKDIFNVVLDTIWAAAVGSDVRITKAQLEVLADITSLELPQDKESPVHFPDAVVPPDFVCIKAILASFEVVMSSPLPRLSYWFYKKLPHMRAAFHHKDAMLTSVLSQARSRLEDSGNAEEAVKSAVDMILQRETQAAQKQRRNPQLDSPAIRDELFGFLGAGSETTATTICWGLKFLTDHQGVQEKFRQSMRDAMANASAENRPPTVDEITSADMPYFDATVEEILRCGTTALAHARLTLCDVDILGIRIPKGTDVFLLTNGPSYLAAPMPVDEKVRSQSSQDSKHKTGDWDTSDISFFKPERWLQTDEKGKISVNLRAGPNNQFGYGIRSCFGKKLAYLEMRVIFTLLFWTFKLLETPQQLSSYRAIDRITHQPEQCYVRLALA